MDEAKSGQRVVLFVDAAQFVPSPFIGLLWCFSRVFIKSPAGRNRFNVLGALNAITHELTMITNDKYINAFSFCELLWEISLKYIDMGENLSQPVYVMAVKVNISEEPVAGKPHGGFCEGVISSRIIRFSIGGNRCLLDKEK